MRWRDSLNGYGWVSIFFHWVTAAAVLALWFVGASIPGSSDERDGLIRLHTTIALSAYLVLVARIYWRMRLGHPDPLPRQGGLSYGLGKVVHYALLAAIALMLLTGPFMAWAGGDPLRLFDVRIPAPFAPTPAAFAMFHRLHQFGANVLLIGVGLHILGVLKHVIVNRDGTFDKIMVPPRPTAAGATTSADP